MFKKVSEVVLIVGVACTIYGVMLTTVIVELILRS